MLADWTNHLKTPEEKKNFRNYVRNSKGITDRLSDILKNMENSLDNRELDSSAYDSPSWAARQADNNGYRRCLRQVQSLLTLDQKEP